MKTYKEFMNEISNKTLTSYLNKSDWRRDKNWDNHPDSKKGRRTRGHSAAKNRINIRNHGQKHDSTARMSTHKDGEVANKDGGMSGYKKTPGSTPYKPQRHPNMQVHSVTKNSNGTTTIKYKNK